MRRGRISSPDSTNGEMSSHPSSSPPRIRTESCADCIMMLSFKGEMWLKVAEEMAIPWRAAEAMHWQLGEQDIARRAGVAPFSLTLPPSSTGSMGEIGTSPASASKSGKSRRGSAENVSSSGGGAAGGGAAPGSTRGGSKSRRQSAVSTKSSDSLTQLPSLVESEGAKAEDKTEGRGRPLLRRIESRDSGPGQGGEWR